MLPQHGGVPNFRMRLSGPVIALLALVLLSGTMITLSFYFYSDPGDPATVNKIKLAFIMTFLLCCFILLTGTGSWWYPHLWKKGNSQKHHRHRHGKSTPSKRHRSHHRSRHHRSRSAHK